MSNNKNNYNIFSYKMFIKPFHCCFRFDFYDLILTYITEKILKFKSAKLYRYIKFTLIKIMNLIIIKFR